MLKNVFSKIAQCSAEAFPLGFKRNFLSFCSGSADVYKVGDFPSCNVSCGFVENVKDIQSRSAAYNKFVCLVVQPRAHHKLEQRHSESCYAFILHFTRDVFEEIAQLVVYLELELRKQLCDGVFLLKECRHRAFAAVCYNTCRECICV